MEVILEHVVPVVQGGVENLALANLDGRFRQDQHLATEQRKRALSQLVKMFGYVGFPVSFGRERRCLGRHQVAKDMDRHITQLTLGAIGHDHHCHFTLRKCGILAQGFAQCLLDFLEQRRVVAKRHLQECGRELAPGGRFDHHFLAPNGILDHLADLVGLGGDAAGALGNVERQHPGSQDQGGQYPPDNGVRFAPRRSAF